VSQYSGAVLADAPNAYWRLGEPNGSVAFDQTASRFNGTFAGGVTLGQPGFTKDGNPSVLFDGASGYVDMGNQTPLAFIGPFTVEAWIKTAATATQRVIAGKVNWATNRGWAFFQDVNQLSFFGVTTGGAYVFQMSVSFTPDSNPHHVVAAWDGTGNPGNAVIYVDGVARSAVSSLNGPGTPDVNTQTFKIGFAVGSGSPYFNGSIQDVAVYPSKLSAARVLAHFQAAIATDPLRKRILDNAVLTLGAMTTAGGYHWDVKPGSVQSDERNLLTGIADTDLPFFLVQPTDKGEFKYFPANQAMERFVFAVTARADAPESTVYNRKTVIGEWLIGDVERALQADITRGGNCVDTKWFARPQELQSVGPDNIVIVLMLFGCVIYRTFGRPDGS
jgi:hypothetical protein